MIAAAANSNGRLVVGHIRRFDPRFLAVAEAVADGRVGRPLVLVGGVSCPREDAVRLGGRVTLALESAIHDLDAMRWLAGDIVRVYAEAVDEHSTPGGDALCATIRFASAAVGALHHTWAMPDGNGLDWEFHFQVSGVNGLADIDGRSRSVSIHATPPAVIFPDTATWPRIHGAIGGALAAEDGHFLAGVRDNRPWPLDLTDARAAVAAALAVDRSIVEGRPVEVERSSEVNSPAKTAAST
jgi:predicted dehydrogenase